MTRKVLDEDYKAIAALRGFVWIGPLPESAHAKTVWRCVEGHAWDAPYSAVKRGSGCRLCRSEKAGDSTRLTAQHYHAVAMNRGWLWLGPPVKSTAEKTEWQCEQGHTVVRTYEHVKRGQGCLVCTNRLPKTEVDYIDLAGQKKIEWLGPKVQSTNSKTLWRCTREHTWESSYNATTASGGCPVCILEDENDEEKLRKLAKELEFEWLGFERKETDVTSKWRCKLGHTLRSTAIKLSMTRMCGQCRKMEANAKLRFGAEEYHALAAKKGLEWIGNKIKKTTEKTRWRCQEKHEWSATFAVIRQLGNCPDCAKNRKAAEKAPLDDFCNELALNRSFQWLGPRVFHKQDSTGWRCPSGHEWNAVVAEVKRRSGCPACARDKSANEARFSSESYHALARRKGYKWLGQEVKKTTDKTEWECDKQHTWFAQYHNLDHGTGCPTCSMAAAGIKKRISAEEYHKAANEKGLQWIGPEVASVKSKTSWRCISGHEIQATYAGIKNGTGCATCNRAKRKEKFDAEKRANPPRRRQPSKGRLDVSFERGKRKRTAEDYELLAEHCGIIWLGPMASTTHALTSWQCRCGKVFNASFLKIMQGRKNGCPSCNFTAAAEKRRRTTDDYRNIGSKMGFTWLGPEVTNNKILTRWRCREKHEWMANYHSLNGGQGCPTCGRISASEKMGLKPADYHTLAERRGFSWVGPVVSSALAKTNWRCSLSHEWGAQYNNIYSGSSCPECAKTKKGQALRKKSVDYELAAKKLGIVWLGPVVSSNREKTNWECQERHEWAAPLSSINSGHSCPTCAAEKAAAARRLSPQSYEECAKRNRIIWKGPVVSSTASKTGWECLEGHTWQADYRHINGGRGCPTCGKAAAAKKTQLPSEAYEELAVQKGIRWIGRLPKNTLSPSEWKCKSDHTWLASYRAVKKMVQCPLCSDIVSGKKTSEQQRRISDILGGVLNYQVGAYNVDIVIMTETDKIAIEYDAWFWHARKQGADAKRDKYLIKMGWKVLRIKSNQQIPSLDTLENHVRLLREGADYSEIVLNDWGIGKIWTKANSVKGVES